MEELQDTAFNIYNLFKKNQKIQIRVHLNCVYDFFIVTKVKRKNKNMIAFYVISLKKPIIFNGSSVINYMKLNYWS